MDLTITLVLLVVFLLAGFGLGQLEMRLRHPRKGSPAEILSQPVQEADSKEPPAEVKVETDLLRISLEPTGSLRFLLEGKRLESPQDVTPEQRGLLVQLLLQLRPWVEGKTGASPKPQPASAIKTPSQATPDEPASTEPAVAEPEPPAVDPNSMVGQIDDLLQKRIAGTPLAVKGVRLQDSSTGGVIFWVGVQHYDNVEAIPDPEAVAAIRAAIAEWEGKK